MVMSRRSVNLTTLFLDRLRPPKRLTSTSCTYFRQKLTSALLESAEGEGEGMWPNRVSNPGTLVLESDALPAVPCDPAKCPCDVHCSRLLHVVN